jgi:hypothetical protein
MTKEQTNSLSRELEVYVHDLREKGKNVSGSENGGRDDLSDRDKENVEFPEHFDEVVECMNKFDVFYEPGSRVEERRDTWSAHALKEGFEESEVHITRAHVVSNSTASSQNDDCSVNFEKLQNEFLRMEALDRKLRQKEMKAMTERLSSEQELESLRLEVESNVEQYESLHGVAPPKVVLQTMHQSWSERYSFNEGTGNASMSRSAKDNGLYRGDRFFLTDASFDDSSAFSLVSESGSSEPMSSNSLRNEVASFPSSLITANDIKDVDVDSCTSERLPFTVVPAQSEENSSCQKSDVTASTTKYPSSRSKHSLYAEELGKHVERNKLMAARFGQTSLTKDEEYRLEQLVKDDIDFGECYGGQNNIQKQYAIDEKLLSRGYWFGDDNLLIDAGCESEDKTVDRQRAEKKLRALRVSAKRSTILVSLQAKRTQKEKEKHIDLALKQLATTPLAQVLHQDHIQGNNSVVMGSSIAAAEVEELVHECKVELDGDDVVIADSKDIDHVLATIRETFAASGIHLTGYSDDEIEKPHTEHKSHC